MGSNRVGKSMPCPSPQLYWYLFSHSYWTYKLVTAAEWEQTFWFYCQSSFWKRKYHFLVLLYENPILHVVQCLFINYIFVHLIIEQWWKINCIIIIFLVQFSMFRVKKTSYYLQCIFQINKEEGFMILDDSTGKVKVSGYNNIPFISLSLTTGQHISRDVLDGSNLVIFLFGAQDL